MHMKIPMEPKETQTSLFCLQIIWNRFFHSVPSCLWHHFRPYLMAVQILKQNEAFFFKTRAKPGRILSATFGFQSCTLKSLLMDKVLWSHMGFPWRCFFKVWSFKQKMRPLGLETCGTFKVTAFSLHGRALNKGERRTWPSSPLWRKTRRFSTKIFSTEKNPSFFF